MSNSDLSSDQVPQAADQPGGGTDPADTAPPAGTSKPRSGFARQKLKLARLSNLYDNLMSDHEELLLRYDQLEQGFEQLTAEYRQLEAAFAEITQLNAALSAELRQAKQQHLDHHRPTPGFSNLMGMMTHG